jgi:hypothetical protein
MCSRLSSQARLLTVPKGHAAHRSPDDKRPASSTLPWAPILPSPTAHLRRPITPNRTDIGLCQLGLPVSVGSADESLRHSTRID